MNNGTLPGTEKGVSCSPLTVSGAFSVNGCRLTYWGFTASKIGFCASRSSTRGLACSANGWLSRIESSPAMWSISPLVSSTASIGECRSPCCGHRAGVARICWRKSGEALTSAQRSPSALTAMLAWVRRWAPSACCHARRLAGVWQFHCGCPPPAADPKTMMRMESCDLNLPATAGHASHGRRQGEHETCRIKTRQRRSS